jgi:molecular chaperone Hsp33
MENERQDSVVRAITDDGSFRVVALRTTDTVRSIVAAQRVKGDEARWLGELVTGTILVRETMAPDLRVQGVLQSAIGRDSLIADSHPDGGARALVQRTRGGSLVLGDGAVLQVTRTLPRGSAHKGVVRVTSGGVSASLMAYLQESEQVASAIAVCTVMDGDAVVAAGGYLVQLLPELGEGQLAVMTARLEDFPPMETLLRDDATTPATLLAELLYLMPYAVVGTGAARYQCRCDSQRLRATLGTLPPQELESLIAEGKELEIECDYCHVEYRFPVAELKSLLAVD